MNFRYWDKQRFQRGMLYWDARDTHDEEYYAEKLSITGLDESRDFTLFQWILSGH